MKNTPAECVMGVLGDLVISMLGDLVISVFGDLVMSVLGEEVTSVHAETHYSCVGLTEWLYLRTAGLIDCWREGGREVEPAVNEIHKS